MTETSTDQRVDYLRSEVLAGLPRNASTFLERTSMLRELSAPLCDAALETTSSARRFIGNDAETPTCCSEPSR